jgi:hypothetical protein
VHGSPSIITANRRRNILNYTRGLLRGALDSGEADRIGLDRGFIVAMPLAGNIVRRSRSPFPDAVARALADPANLDRMAASTTSAIRVCAMSGRRSSSPDAGAAKSSGSSWTA